MIVLPHSGENWSIEDVGNIELRLVRILALAGTFEIEAEGLHRDALRRREQIPAGGKDHVGQQDARDGEDDDETVAP